ncbi:MAG: ComEC/Rec2 family competence protein [Patescibacteria group bacterium]
MVVSLFSGFILGLFVGSLTTYLITLCSVFFFLFLIFFFYKNFLQESQKKVFLYIAICLLGISLGLLRMNFSNLNQESELASYVGQKISVVGVVVSEPDVRESSTRYHVRIIEVLGPNIIQKIDEKILVSVPTYPKFSYGDKVEMVVTLSEPSEIENDGRVFDYVNYLRVRGVWLTSRFTTIKFLESGHGNPVKEKLFAIKSYFVSSIKNTLPEPESSLLGGLLLGSKQSLGKELLDDFQKTGVSHIVVLSGYNIALVANSIVEVFKFLPKHLSFGFGAVGIFLFALLSGGGASVWRASIMVLVALFAKHSNRDYNAAKILGFTIFVMLFPNPLLLVFDPSFQLSVLATIGLVFVSPVLLPYLTKVPERFGLREIVSTTLSTQVTVLPLLLYSTGLFSVVSLPVNILVLVTIPFAMLLGFVTGLFGLVSFYLAFIPGIFTYIFLWYELKVIEVGADIPFAAVSLPAFSPIFLFVVYAIIFLWLYILKKKKL